MHIHPLAYPQLRQGTGAQSCAPHIVTHRSAHTHTCVWYNQATCCRTLCISAGISPKSGAHAAQEEDADKQPVRTWRHVRVVMSCEDGSKCCSHSCMYKRHTERHRRTQMPTDSGASHTHTHTHTHLGPPRCTEHCATHRRSAPGSMCSGRRLCVHTYTHDVHTYVHTYIRTYTRDTRRRSQGWMKQSSHAEQIVSTLVNNVMQTQVS